jgi:hypothetical protein
VPIPLSRARDHLRYGSVSRFVKELLEIQPVKASP